jgi:DNA-binding FadR family transcriptional regulator
MDEHALAYSQPMVGTPKSSDPRRDVIANQLREAIISGRFKAGERLIEDALAEEHGVSRVPVREALRRLETEGFVVLTPYRSATVLHRVGARQPGADAGAPRAGGDGGTARGGDPRW